MNLKYMKVSLFEMLQEKMNFITIYIFFRCTYIWLYGNHEISLYTDGKKFGIIQVFKCFLMLIIWLKIQNKQ